MRPFPVRAAAILAVLAVGTPARAQLTFTITNGGGATPQMMTAFAEAAALWSVRLSDPITVNITVKAAALPTGVLGHTDTFYDPYAYSAVRAALVADRTSADDFSSTAALQPGSAFAMLINKTANNPNGVVSATPYFDTGLGGPGQAGPENNSTVRITSANAKALGLYPANAAGPDGIITVSTAAIYDFNRADGVAANKIDFVGVAAHEIGHLLGFVSGVDVLAGNATAPGKPDNQLQFVTPLDLFRFSARSVGPGGGVGVIDWTDDDADKYFSVDGGATAVATFSVGPTYEASHWKIAAPVTGIMDPTAVGGELLTITNTDLRALDVIGYNVAPVPEPASGLAAGFAAAAGYAILRRRVQNPTR